MRKSMVKQMILVLICMAIWISSPAIGRADMEWRILKDLDLKTSPLDVASSADGQRLFILTPGEILVYSLPEEKISDRIAVGKDFDRITSHPRGDVLIITSSLDKTLQIILLEAVFKIDLTDHPFKGPKEAPVTVAVFTDYQ